MKLEESPVKLDLKPRQRESKSRKPKNGELPDACHESQVWRRRVIPTFFRWASVQSNPWNIPDDKIVGTLDTICQYHYDGIVQLDTSTSSPAFGLVRFHLHAQSRY